jgi:taurine dioxygenase
MPCVKKSKGRSCKHDATRNSAGQLRAGFDENYDNESRPGAIHPLVIKHHATGKESLYVGRRPKCMDCRAVRIKKATSFWMTFGSISKMDHIIGRNNGRPKDIVIWDNRYTLHMRGDLDPAHDRLMHRTQIQDDAAPAAA